MVNKPHHTATEKNDNLMAVASAELKNSVIFFNKSTSEVDMEIKAVFSSAYLLLNPATTACTSAYAISSSRILRARVATSPSMKPNISGLRNIITLMRNNKPPPIYPRANPKEDT